MLTQNFGLPNFTLKIEGEKLTFHCHKVCALNQRVFSPLFSSMVTFGPSQMSKVRL